MRIKEHPIIDYDLKKKISFIYDGRSIDAYENDTIASALYAAGFCKFRDSLELKRPRGFFCAIGNCSSCAMEVDGIANVRTCITPVREGMVVKTQTGLPHPKDIRRPAEEPVELATDVVVVGGGPAGLKAALAAAEQGADVIVVDENYMLGGQLVKQTHKFFGSADYYAGARGTEIGRLLIKSLESKKNIRTLLDSVAVGFEAGNLLQVSAKHGERCVDIRYKKAIVACGAGESMLNVENNDLPGVYGAGAVQTLVNVYGAVIGKKVLIVGAGNVGLILAYHLLQAGTPVAAVVEAMPRVGGYLVHAAKIKRHGVPIYTSHSLSSVSGTERVSGATIVALGEGGRPIPGTEKTFDVDTVALAVGLQPNYRLCYQAKCDFKYVPELSGYVPKRDRFMRTSDADILIAGDCTGIEEATTAMMEGEIAGLAAAGDLGFSSPDARKRIDALIATMGVFRSTHKGLATQKGIEQVTMS